MHKLGATTDSERMAVFRLNLVDKITKVHYKDIMLLYLSIHYYTVKTKNKVVKLEMEEILVLIVAESVKMPRC